MKQDHSPAPPIAPDRPAAARRPMRPGMPRWLRVLAEAGAALALLAVAALVVRTLMAGPPGTDRREAPRTAPLVAVETVSAATRGPLIEAWGVVEPERALTLRAEVAGRVVWRNPALAPGGLVEEGETLFRLDEEPFDLDIAEAEARIAEIEARMRLEAGQQARARQDLERSPLQRDLTEEQRGLILREPQQAELEAQRAAAVAARDSAVLDRERATVLAPFDALVESESVAPGTVLASGAEAARLVGIDRFRLVLAVPPEALDRLDLDEGQTVALSQPGVWPEGATREGRLQRLAPGLTEQGRMAEIIATVPDPLARGTGRENRPRVLLGSFLRARIPGRPVEGAVALDRAWLRDGSTVWVATPDDRLEIRKVEIAWRGASEVLVTDGLAPGERVVTTALATVADGMALRTAGGGDP